MLAPRSAIYVLLHDELEHLVLKLTCTTVTMALHKAENLTTITFARLISGLMIRTKGFLCQRKAFL